MVIYICHGVSRYMWYAWCADNTWCTMVFPLDHATVYLCVPMNETFNNKNEKQIKYLLLLVLGCLPLEITRYKRLGFCNISTVMSAFQMSCTES